MLYLFNSGFRDGYVANVLKTLCLPDGSSNLYSYRTGDADGNVTIERSQQVHDLPENEQVLIIFVDRYYGSQRYGYQSLRRGRLLRATVKDDRLNIRVRLTEFCAGDATFSQRVEDNLVKLGAPRFVDSTDNTRDGQYAVICPTDITSPGECGTGGEKWKAIVNGLSETHALQSTQDQPVVFARAEFRRDGDPNQLTPEVTPSGDQIFRINRGQKHTLSVNYFFPIVKSHRIAGGSLDVTLGSQLNAISAMTQALDLAERPVEFSFTSGPSVSDATSNIILTATPPEGLQFFAPKIDLPLEIVQGTRQWLGLVFLAVLYCVCAVAIAYDPSKPLDTHAIWLKLGGFIVQGIVVIFMLRWFGQKLG
jgi:hypothetical protein